MASLTPSGNLQRSSEVLREGIIHIPELYDIHYSIERVCRNLVIKLDNIKNPDRKLKVALYLMNLRNKFNDVSLYSIFLFRTIQCFTLVKSNK